MVDTSKVLDTLIKKEYKFKPAVLKCTSVLLSFATLTFPAKVLAENTDALGGGTATETTPSSTITVDQANEVVQNIKDAIPEPSRDTGLELINDAVEKGRSESFGMAGELAQPVIWFFMLLANFIWYVMTALFTVSTAIDVLSIVSPWVRSLVARQDADANQQGHRGGIGGFIRSFFQLSMDAEQVLASAGMNPSTTGNGSAGGTAYGSAGGSAYGGSAYGSQAGGSAYGGAGNANNGSGNKPVSSGNLLVRYAKKRALTLIFLGVTYVIFGTSFATEFQADMVSYIMALIQAFLSVVRDFFTT